MTGTDQERIDVAVRNWERWPRNHVEPIRRVYGRSLYPFVALAEEDIEHETFGTVAVATGSDWQGPISSNGIEYQAYNNGLKIWSGSRLLVSPAALSSNAKFFYENPGAFTLDEFGFPGELDTVIEQSGGNMGFISQAFSATRIRGRTPQPDGIGPGFTVTITSCKGINGHYNSSTAVATSYFQHHTMDNNLNCKAELEFDTETRTSKWFIYCGDCNP